jgi:hypothetical protein
MSTAKHELVISKITSIINRLKQAYNGKDRKKTIDANALREEFKIGSAVFTVLKRDGIYEGTHNKAKVTSRVLSVDPIDIYKKAKAHNTNMALNSKRHQEKLENREKRDRAQAPMLETTKHLRKLMLEEEATETLEIPENYFVVKPTPIDPSNKKEYEVLKVVPYQACPICNGIGQLQNYSICNVCNGSKIIPMHIVK